MLQASFVNWRLAMLGFLALPAALVGGLLAAYFGGGIIGLGSLVGFLTVLGIAARNGIMLISHYQHLGAKEGVAFGPGLVIRGARERISPIMMTALTTALTLVPLLIAGSIPGQRNRASDGDRHSRRPRHFDAAESVRHAVALPALRGEWQTPKRTPLWSPQKSREAVRGLLNRDIRAE